MIANNPMFAGIEDHLNEQGNGLLDVWMSHGDKVVEIPAGFVTTAQTPTCPHAAMANETKQFYGVNSTRK